MAVVRLTALPSLLGLLAFGLGTPTEASGDKVNIIASRIRSVPISDESTEPALLVIVLDHEGRGLEGIQVAVHGHKGAKVASGRTAADGRLVLRIATPGDVSVRAAEVGFVTTEVRNVELRRSSFAAVALPLEVAEVTDPLTSR